LKRMTENNAQNDVSRNTAHTDSHLHLKLRIKYCSIKQQMITEIFRSRPTNSEK